MLFWHRKSKADKNGLAPVICRISVDGDDEEIGTGRKVHIDNWDVENKMATGGKVEKQTNAYLAGMTNDLETYFKVLQSQHEVITPLMLKNVYLVFVILLIDHVSVFDLIGGVTDNFIA